MATYYVDSASAGGNGTTQDLSGANAAFATVAAAQAAVTGDKHGSSLLFKRGCTWREQFTLNVYGTADGQFTVGAYGEGDLPKFLGSTQVSTWSDETGNVWSAACAADPVSVWFVLPSGVIIWGTEVANKAACAAEYDWAWVDADDKLYVYAASDPDSRYSSVEKPTRPYGVYANAKNYVTVQDVEVAFCFESPDARGIFFYGGTNGIIERCVAHHNGDMGDGTDPQGNGILVYNNNNLILRDNVTYENARRGTAVFTNNSQTANGMVIERNISYNNYHAQFDCFLGSGELDGLIIRRNLAYLNSDYGAHGKGALTAHGIYLQSDHATIKITNAQIYYNVVHHMKQDTLICIAKGVNGALIYNNLAYGAFEGSTWSPGIEVRQTGNSNITVKNNIAVDCIAGCFRVVTAANVVACDNNLWFQSGGGAAVYADIGGTSYHFDDFAAYKAATDWDAAGLWEDPKFVDAEGLDFRLASDSPCINAGADVDLVEDYAGNGIW